MIVSSKNTKPTLTIIIVNYNVKDFLLQCLRSIERASHQIDVEVIVVDNRSNDGSLSYLRPLFPTVEFIELSENIGFGRGNNVGILKALGKYTLLLNPDTILADDTLTMMCNYMEYHSEVGIAGCKVLNSDGTFQVACRRGFPTPWASFCKLFGLQRLFPKSPLFARYNQTFRSENETYYVDAVIGAFMFCDTEVLQKVGGFDPDYFMYGEDLDLCYRVSLTGKKISYYHETTTIHFKGESTKRSSMNEVKVFYNAMEIFAQKHYGNSLIFLNLLRLGIWLRSMLAYLIKHKQITLIIIWDCLVLNASLLVATKIRFGNYLGFPTFAYPAVFIAITLLFLVSMLAVEGYFEKRAPVRKLISGLMVTFFVLSSFTYFFKEYAFSRGVILMMIMFTLVLSSLIRLGLTVVNKLFGHKCTRRLAIIGMNSQTESIVTSLLNSEQISNNIVGIIATESYGDTIEFCKQRILGNVEYLAKIISENSINEIIVTESIENKLKLVSVANSLPSVKFYFAESYEKVIVSRILTEVTGTDVLIPKLQIKTFRNRIAKRGLDLLISIFLLTVGLPLVSLFAKNVKEMLKNILKVLIGNHSLIGIYPIENSGATFGKIGIISLVHLNNPYQLSEHAIQELNSYYEENYTLSLDLDICLKYYWQK